MTIRQNDRLGDEGVDKVGTVTLVSDAGTLNRRAGIVTSEASTLAAGSAVSYVITNSEVAAGDIVMVSRMGGTSNEGTEIWSAVATANTITVLVENRHASAAFDGTFIFAFLVIKA